MRHSLPCWALILAASCTACTRSTPARLGDCKPLHYAPGTAPEADRTWVRAASGVAPFGDALAIVQDDAHFLATIRGDEVTPITLAQPGAVAPLADDPRVTRGDKLDLESITAIDDGARLLAFGSGSAPMRRVLVVLERGSATGILHDASPFFDGLAASRDFAGSELNVEGAVQIDQKIRFFQRGNGAHREGAAPVNATADVDRDALLAWIDHGGPPPAVENVRRHDLGQIGGVPLAFTDATFLRGDVIFVAVAEASPDATRDGEVVGVRVGRFRGGAVEMLQVVENDGRPTTRKIEGLTPSATPGVLHAVVDADDPKRAAEICALTLPPAW
jgi:hypothetical protein